MELHEKRTFIESLYGMAEVYQTTLTEAQVAGYWGALRDLPLRDVKAGMIEAVRAIEFFPKPAEIRRLAYSGETQAPTPAPLALMEPHDPTVAKAAIQAILAHIDSIAERRAMPATSDAELHQWVEVGKRVMDWRAVDRARGEAVRRVRGTSRGRARG